MEIQWKYTEPAAADRQARWNSFKYVFYPISRSPPRRANNAESISTIFRLPAAAGISKPLFQNRLVFQRKLVFCGGVSRQLFKCFVKSASMGEKATQRQGIDGMRIQIAWFYQLLSVFNFQNILILIEGTISIILKNVFDMTLRIIQSKSKFL